MVNKKAQMKIQQTAFVLLAVTLFFVFVGLFILMINFSDIQETAQLLKEENALILAAKLADSPEFSCGNSFDEVILNCIDADKVIGLSETSAYKNFFGIDGIEIQKIYSKKDKNVLCTSLNYPDCGIIRVLPIKTGTSVSSFVSLCRKQFENANESEIIYGKCELAKIFVAYDA